MNWLAKTLETSRTEFKGNIRPMEGLRGWAVTLVFAVHYAGLFKPWFATSSPTTALLDGIHGCGQCGVDLFFVLSGFLIYGSLLTRGQAYFRFISRRIRRIYPTYLAVFAIYLFLSMVDPSENKIPPTFRAGTLFLVSNLLLLPGVFDLPTLISVAWSLSYEMLFYLALPLILSLGRFRTMGRQGRVLTLCALAIVGISAYWLHGGPVRLVMFIAGALVFETVEARKETGLNGAFTVIVFLFSLLCFSDEVATPLEMVLRTSVLFLSLYCVGVVCLGNRPGWLGRLMSVTPIRWLGNMSYSYYLIHGLTIKALLLGLAKVWAPAKGLDPFFLIVFLPFMFAATLVVSFALFSFIERPFSLTSRRVPGPNQATPDQQAQHAATLTTPLSDPSH